MPKDKPAKARPAARDNDPNVVSDIPPAQVGRVVQAFVDDGVTSVLAKETESGKWSVAAA